MPVYRFGPFLLEPSERRLSRSGTVIALTGKTIDVLLLLVEAGGRLVDRATFQDRLWPDTVVEERNLTVHISTLRRILNDGDDADYIETVPRAGYRLTVPVEPVEAAEMMETAAAAGTTETAAAPEPRRRWPRLRGRLALAALLLCNFAGLAWYGYASRSGAGTAPLSLAVLPLVTPDLDEGDRYLGLGIADAVITQLGGLPQLNVRPTSAVRDLAGADPVEVGRRLQVGTVLDGMIWRQNDRLLVSVQLVDVENGAIRWGARFEQPLSDAFVLQGLVAERVAVALLPRLATPAVVRSDRPPASEAYLLQMQARVQLGHVERDPALRAVELFRQAIALDPGYGRAYSGLAAAYMQLTATEMTRVLSAEDGVVRAQAAAEQALKLEPGLGEARAILATLKFTYDWDWNAAGEEYRLALAVSPNSPEVAESYGWYLAACGRFDEALAWLRHAHDLDPVRRQTQEYIGFTQWMAGDPQAGLEALRQASEIDPRAHRPHLRRMFILDDLQQHDAAMAARVKWLTLFDGQSLADRLLAVQHDQGYRAAMVEWIRFLDRFDQPFETALQWMALDEHGQALAALERCVMLKCTPAPFLAVLPSFRPLHGDPRFRTLLGRLNMEPRCDAPM
ncbi:winged helix-turn-helix domain-containing protein [Ferrovibrio sp.]|uniref:winged helix-turn-helix domain-containing tetratricopeptide repeat protein n=1 Tax=Ferrovibrio sp. TaxID=1917215 RepID=UPI00311FD09C